MKRNNIFKFGSLLLASSLAIAGLSIVLGNNSKNFIATEAASSRTMTFSAGKSSVTTSAKNTFSSHWIEQASGSTTSNSSYYAVLKSINKTVSGVWQHNNSILGIYGKYKMNNITKITIKWKATNDNTNRNDICFDLYALKSATSLGACKTIYNGGGEYTSDKPLPSSSWQTTSFATPFTGSVYGIALKVSITNGKNGQNSINTITTYVESVTITYTC